ncbi:MAG TPA: MFS transporter, partial [Acidimicrobiia bacterium]|nr:MFS transporter [Acidimicrobiia bacterium]
MKPFRILFPTDRFNPHDRAVALVMWTVGVVQGFAQAQPASTLPFIRVALGLTEGEISALLAIARLLSLGAIVIAMVGDRRGRRLPLLGSYVLLVVATGATALIAGPLGFATTQGLVRIGTSAISALGVVWLAEQLSPAVRAYGVSLYGAAGSLGAGAAILALPLAERDWRLPYLLTLAGLALVPWLSKRVHESPLMDSEP